MAKGIGRQIQIGIARETTRGTGIASAAYWIPRSEGGFDDTDERAPEDQAYGVVEDSIGEAVTKKWAEGNISAPIGDKHFGLILASVFGLPTSTVKAAETIVYEHAFAVSQSAQKPSLSIFLDDPIAGVDKRHVNGVVGGLELNYEIGNAFVGYSADIRAKQGTTLASSPAAAAENKFLARHTTVKIASALAGLDAAAALTIRRIKISLGSEIEDDEALDVDGISDFLAKQFVVEGEIEATWENESDWKTMALAATTKAMRIDLVNDEVTIGNTSNPALRLDMAKVTFRPVTRAIGLNDIVRQTLGFKAHYSLGDAKMITARLTNLVAAY